MGQIALSKSFCRFLALPFPLLLYFHSHFHFHRAPSWNQEKNSKHNAPAGPNLERVGVAARPLPEFVCEPVH